ncbi:MAG: T9SS type A sorting domain-containing protein [Bacteroidetes bacterium]|nr:T9SS type A sorting domain-containing protein [Bacteroidota bacterium]
MKKIIITTFLIVITTFGFSQIKYITFTDSIKLDPTLMYPIENYGVSSIPSENGYVFTGCLNDWTNLNYYYANIDFAGNIISDQTISIQPINSGPYPTIISRSVTPTNVTLWSGISNALFNNQSLLINLDNYGNYLWSKYYGIDTLVFEVRGGFRSSDDGLLTYGFATNWDLINYGFISKTDQNGTVLWSKFYGQKLYSTIPGWNGNVENLTETPDGGFLFSNGVDDDTLPNRYPTIIKIDTNGDFQWSKTIEFLAPIDNLMDGGSSVRAILPIDDNNMLIALEVMDTLLGARKLGLIAMDPNFGSINWSKSYFLNPGDGGFNLDKIIRKSDGNFVGYYNQDMIGSVLFELDQFGGMIKTVQLRELPIASQNNTYYNGISPTNDGGVILSSSLLANSPGVLLFKADKYLETHCPETEYPSLANEDTLGMIFRTSLDTSFAVTFNEQTVSLASPMAIAQSTTDPYCSCELIVYGNVSYTGSIIPADSVMVFLYEITETGSYLKRDSVETDVAGYYQFNYLPEGQYVVKAIPSLIKYPNYLPTYFNNLTGATQWDSAYVLNLACGGSPIDGNINLIQKLPQTGAWQCNGYVLEYYGYNSGAKMAPGEPIPDIDITIDQSPGGTISSATTDVNGYFAFTGLNNNATFIVRADIPGLPNDSIYTFTVTPGDPALDSLNFYVDTVGVYILPEYIFTSVNVIQSKNVNVSIAPNPTNSNFVLEVMAEKNTNIKINLSNSIGQLIFSKNSSLTTGNNKIQFDIKDYPQGIYYMSINYENNHFIKKIIKQ